MKNAAKVGVFYSRGPHFVKALKFLRAAFPDARLTAIVPPGFPGNSLENCCDEILEAGGTRGLMALLRAIRAAGFDEFVILFPSLKQRLLAQFSGASERYCYSVNGDFQQVRLALISSLAGAVYRTIRGRLTYAYIYYVVHHRPVHGASDK